jgi:hypothetical protein
VINGSSGYPQRCRKQFVKACVSRRETASRSAYPPSTRVDALQAQEDQALARELAAETPATPDTAALHAVADQLARVIANGDTDQAKTLLRILIADLRINSRAEILPTYRVGTPVVCAQTSSVEPADLKSNRSARLSGGRMSLGGSA